MKWQDRFSSPERKRQYVRSLFATIADRYDLITVLLSGGLDKRWKRRLVAKIPAPKDAAALDLACGTGDIAFELAAAGSRVIGLDITPRMVRLASLKPQRFRHGVSFVTGDMMALPIPDAILRRRHHRLRTAERTRTSPVRWPRFTGCCGPAGCCSRWTSTSPPIASSGPCISATSPRSARRSATVLHGDPDTYRYIPESIQRYPGAAGVCALARTAGFARCTHQPVLGGFLAMHSATK